MSHSGGGVDLELAGVTLVHPGAAAPLLHTLSLRIEAGEIVAILGPSGCGKSSLIRVCLGLSPEGSQVSGSVRVAGTEVAGCAEEQWRTLRGSTLGWMTQAVATALEPREHIADQLVPVVSRLSGLDEEQARATLLQHLHELGVESPESYLSRRWGQLSGGQQRLALASLWLSIRPCLLFIDEPSVGLDAVHSRRLVAALRGARDATGLTVLAVSHDWNFARALADRCLVMRDGALEPVDLSIDDVPSSIGLSQGPETADVLLRVRGLYKVFPQVDGDLTAVSGLNLDVRRGRVAVLWGRSGSGKTTAARCMLRLLEPDGGELFFRGLDLRAADESQLRALRKDMQLVEQDAHSTINPKWEARKILTEGARWHGVHRGHLDEDVAFWMDALGLSEGLLKRRGKDLSIGEAQRFAIARALLLQPELLLLDEPSANLDRESRRRLITTIRRYLSRIAGGILLITHDTELVRAVADQVIELDKGMAAQPGRPLPPPHHERTVRSPWRQASANPSN